MLDDSTADMSELEARIATLTAREREILLLLAEGLTNGEICRRLNRTAKTVDTHLSSVRRKLGVRDRVRLARIAITAGLVAVERGPGGEARDINRGLREELSRRNLAQEALRQIDAAVTPVAGDEFLTALTEAFCMALRVEAAIIAETTDRDGEQMLSLRAAYRRSGSVHFPPLSLAATRLGTMAPHATLRLDDASDDAFAMLVADGANPPSLIGMLLHDAAGALIGALALAGTTPIDDRLEPELILRVHAGRVAAELVRLRAEAQLRASEARYRLLAENSTDMISVHAPSGAYTYASPACEALLGYRPDEIIGKSAYDLMEARDIPKVGEAHHALLTDSKSAQVRFQVRRKDGRRIWLDTITQVVRDPETGDIKALTCVSRNVTDEQMMIEKLVHGHADLEALVQQRTMELRNSERRWRSVCEFASEMICIIDEDLRVTYVNRTLPEYSFDDVVGTPIADFLDEPKEAFLDALRAVLRTGQPRTVLVDSMTPSGRRHWATNMSPLVENDRIVGVVCIGRDMTDERRTEDALRESERRYRLLFETSPEGLLVHDGEHVRMANERAAELLGYPDPASMLGVHILDLVQEEFHTIVQERVRSLLAGAVIQPRMRQVLRQCDGSPVLLDVAAGSCTYEGKPAVQVSMRPVNPDVNPEWDGGTSPSTLPVNGRRH